MIRFFIIGILALLVSADARAQETENPRPWQPLHAPLDYSRISAEIERNREALGLDPIDPPSADALRSSFDRLIYPVRARPNADLFRAQFIGNYVDLDAASPGSLRDWACGGRTYDLNTGYDHAGTDISIAGFRAHAMNQGWVEVVAAAPGVIIARNDNAPDRNCGGLSSNRSANFVSIQQDDGLLAYYWHLAINSLTDKQVGDRVEAGEYLGLVGSSGISTAPHLHFELRYQTVTGAIIDPYEGICGQGETLWRHQHSYADPAITAIYTHNFTPENVSGSFCQPEYPRFRSDFEPGDTVYLGVYVRDLTVGGAASVEIHDPQGQQVFQRVFGQSTVFAAVADYQASYTLPQDAIPGQWVIRAHFQGDVRERAFSVGGAPNDGARLAAAVLPGSRSVQAGQPATVFATVLNPSGVDAAGCWIGPGAPLAGLFEYRETDPATNAVTGETNALFSIPAGEARSFVIAVTPNADGIANSYDFPLRYKCENSDAAALRSGVNTVLLSFGPNPVPDLIAIAVTPENNGILRLADSQSAAAFATAVANVGAAGEMTLRPVGNDAAGSLRLRICETDPVSGGCLSPASESVTRTFAADETASFAVFARGQGEEVSFSPAANRIRLVATDASGVIRGSTSVAVRTQ